MAQAGMVHFFLDVAQDVERRRLAGSRSPGGSGSSTPLGRLLVYGPLRDNLGMRRIRRAYTAGEAIGPEIFVFFRALGVNVKQLYGMTESSVFVASSGTARCGSTRWARRCPASRSGSPSRARCSSGAPGSSRATTRTRGDPPDARGRLGHSGRRRLHRPRRPPQDHRPRPGRRPPGRRDPVRAQVPREQAEVLALHPGGGLHRPGRPVRGRARQHRPRGGGGTGPSGANIAYTSYTDLSQKPEVYELIRAGDRCGEPEPRQDEPCCGAPRSASS